MRPWPLKCWHPGREARAARDLSPAKRFLGDPLCPGAMLAVAKGMCAAGSPSPADRVALRGNTVSRAFLVLLALGVQSAGTSPSLALTGAALSLRHELSTSCQRTQHPVPLRLCHLPAALVTMQKA